MNESMYVVAGVSGHTGAAVASELISQGKKVRVIVRNVDKGASWKAKGCEVAVADLNDVNALTAAMKDAAGVYLLSPPNMAAGDFLADRTALIHNMAKAVKASGVKKVVYLSSVGAQHASGTGPIVTAHRAELAFQGAAPSITFIRASYFLENWGSMIPLAKSQGILPHYGDINVKFSQVNAADIGKTAASELLNQKPGHHIVELAGTEDWSVTDVAATLGELLHTKVQPIAAPVAAAKDGLVQAGLPAEMARLYAEMYEGMSTGKVARESKEVTRGKTSLKQALSALL
jgi:uncharacterized protein YbjT (DUF2867 family)